jgi:hypothetical protein
MAQSVRQSKLLLAAIAFVLFGASGRIEATTLVPMDAAELADQAELVFTGTAVQSRVVLSKDGDPYTFVTFAVHDVLKGWTLERQLALRLSGGETESGVVRLEGMPQFEQGETYLLFVNGNGSLMCPILGWWQGQFRFGHEAGSGKQILVDSDGVAVRGVAQRHFERAERGDASAGMTVLSEQGVHVELPRKLSAATEAVTPDARQVLGQLRSFIAGRATAGTFRPGRRVDSARPQDLPAHRAIPAVRQQ